jgi:hypothetical protein
MWIKKLIPAYIQIKSLYTIQQEKILDKELTNLFHLIDTDEYDAAKRVLEILRKKYGDTVPELTKASSMLHFLTCI